MIIYSQSEQQTLSAARALAATLAPGDVVAISGELGAGKSLFCRGVLRALGVRDAALPSPTFAIIQEYEGDRCRLAHMDWYRLDDLEEIEMLGVGDFFQPPWITLIEWPERAQTLLPERAIRITMRCATDEIDGRTIEISGCERLSI